MTHVGTLVKRMPLVIVANITAAAAGIWFQVILSHRLSPTAFGTYAAVLATLYAVSQVFESNSYAVAGREVEGEGADPDRVSFGLSLLLGVGAVGPLALWWWLEDGQAGLDVWAGMAAGLVLMSWSVLWWLRGLAQGRLLDVAYVNNRSIEMWSRLLLGLAILGIGQSIPMALLATALGGLAACLPLLVVLRRGKSSPPAPTRNRHLAGQLKAFGRMAAVYLPLALFLRLDTMLAPQVFVDSAIGTYGVVSTIGKAVLVYALALSPLMFPRLVSERIGRERFRMIAVGCALSVAVLGGAALVFHLYGSTLIGASFGTPFLAAIGFVPMYLVLLIPVAVHANVINLLLAMGKGATIGILWAEVALYYVLLRWGGLDMGAYMIVIGLSQTVMAAIGLTMALRCRTAADAPASEAGVRFGNHAVGGVDRVGRGCTAPQVQRNRLSGRAHQVGVRVHQEVPDAVVDRDGVPS